jgi:hypothetical protein
MKRGKKNKNCRGKKYISCLFVDLTSLVKLRYDKAYNCRFSVKEVG